MLEQKLEVLTQSVDHLSQIIGQLLANHTGATTPAPTADKPAAKATTKPDPKAETPAADPAGPEVTLDQVTKAVLALGKAKGRVAAVNVLRAHGADTIPQLDASQYAAVVSACNAALK